MSDMLEIRPKFRKNGVKESRTAVNIRGKVVRDIDPDKYEKDENMFGTMGRFGHTIAKKIIEGRYANRK